MRERNEEEGVMKKPAIFDEVATILQEDSSTKKDIAGADPSSFSQENLERDLDLEMALA